MTEEINTGILPPTREEIAMITLPGVCTMSAMGRLADQPTTIVSKAFAIADEFLKQINEYVPPITEPEPVPADPENPADDSETVAG